LKKYILVGLAVVVLEWIFVAVISAFFNGLSLTDSIVIGTGFFLAFEMVVCTGAIITKIRDFNHRNSEDNNSR